MNLRRILPIKCLLLLVLFVRCNDGDDGFTEQVNVLVDFAVPKTNVKSMSGFLHGINIDDPADSLITLLEPRLLRGGSGFYEVRSRKARFSSKNILSLSDLWHNGPGKGFSVMPYENYEVYKNFLRTVIDTTRNSVIYDVWNEPDVGFLWKGTKEQFFECFKIAHDVIREELGNSAMISGPSTHWLPEWIHGFAHYCNQNDVQLDVFSYHELYETDNLYSVQQHLRDLHSIINNNYTNLRVKEIHVNEYGYYGSQHNPALILGYLYNLERGGADGACRACWEDLESGSTCWNGTIGGLLTPGDLRPRASWWTHKLYAESVSERVQSDANTSFIANFAYRHPTDWKRARIIIANAHQKETVKELNVIINSIKSLSFVANTDASVNIRVYEIPNTEEAAVESMVLKREGSYVINKNSTKITFTDVKPYTNYVLEISQDR